MGDGGALEKQWDPGLAGGDAPDGEMNLVQLPEHHVVVEHSQEVGDVILRFGPVSLVLLPILHQGLSQPVAQQTGPKRTGDLPWMSEAAFPQDQGSGALNLAL